MSKSSRTALRSAPLCAAVSAALLFLSPQARATDGAPADADPQVKTLDRVQVRGVRDAAEAERALTPGSVTVVDADTFQARAVANLADALRYVPGLFSESGTGGDAVFISSRGSNLDATDYDSNGIKLFQDGLPVTTADGNNHNRFPDPMTARYMTVARGANALTYGASNLGGAIDFTSPTARNGDPLAVFLGVGSDGQRDARLTLGGVGGDLDGLLTLDARDRDGYREHSRQRRRSLYANGGWQLAPGLELRAFASHVDNKEQLAGALTRAQVEDDPSQANPSAITGNFQLNVRTDRLAAKADWRIDDDRQLVVGASFEEQDLFHPIVDKIMVDFDGPGPMPPVEVFSLLKNTRQRTTAGMARYNVRIGDHDVLAGINLADTREEGGLYRNDGGRRNGLRTVVDNRSRATEAFLVDRWALDADWTLVYGAQGVLTSRDVRNTDVASGTLRNPKADYSAFNPRLGAIRRLGEGREAYASVGRLFEAPTTFELEDDVRGGSATLDPMHGNVVEAGLRGDSGGGADAVRWNWDVSAYYAAIRDEILSVDDPQAPGTSLSTNVDRTVHAGLEALVSASIPVGGVRIEPLLSASLNHFVFDDDAAYGDNRLPAAPRHAWRGEVMLRTAGGFFAGPTFDVVGARYADFSNTYRLDGYHLFGLRAGIEGDRWRLFAEVRNLADTTYVGALSVRDRASASDAILQPGAPRTFQLGLRWRF
ncbi:MAG: TonB-dependent receptor [Xanthomonadales bacterium]|nr:TonB-dependent receptor [Xanthomonadales bacterium]